MGICWLYNWKVQGYRWPQMCWNRGSNMLHLSALMSFIFTLFSGHMGARRLPGTVLRIFWDSREPRLLRFTLVDLALNQLIIVTSRTPCVPVDGGLWMPNQTIWEGCGGETNTSKPKWTCYKDTRNAINKYPFHPKQPSWKCSERIRWKKMSG